MRVPEKTRLLDDFLLGVLEVVQRERDAAAAAFDDDGDLGPFVEVRHRVVVDRGDVVERRGRRVPITLNYFEDPEKEIIE